MNKFKSFIKKLLCRHYWIRVHEKDRYFDYRGFSVFVWECRCEKCGKLKNRKYITFVR